MWRKRRPKRGKGEVDRIIIFNWARKFGINRGTMAPKAHLY